MRSSPHPRKRAGALTFHGELGVTAKSPLNLPQNHGWRGRFLPPRDSQRMRRRRLQSTRVRGIGISTIRVRLVRLLPDERSAGRTHNSNFNFHETTTTIRSVRENHSHHRDSPVGCRRIPPVGPLPERRSVAVGELQSPPLVTNLDRGSSLHRRWTSWLCTLAACSQEVETCCIVQSEGGVCGFISR